VDEYGLGMRVERLADLRQARLRQKIVLVDFHENLAAGRLTGPALRRSDTVYVILDLHTDPLAGALRRHRAPPLRRTSTPSPDRSAPEESPSIHRESGVGGWR
jgi:hypothetical protein